MSDKIILLDGKAVGYITDDGLANALDGTEHYLDGMYEYGLVECVDANGGIN